MPDWSHVVGYEEDLPEVLNAMACGYPRFFRHPRVVELTALIQSQNFPQDDPETWEMMPIPTKDVAERLQRFLVDSSRNIGVKSEDVSVHLIQELVHVVRFPHTLQKTAAQFWQHSGEIVSSRHAEKLLKVLKTGEGAAPALGQTESHSALKKRVGELYLKGDNIEDKVALYPTGMAAIFACEWCAQGVYFFPTVGEKEKKQVEEIVAREKVLGIFTEFPGNPLLSMADLKWLAKLAHGNGTALVVDDTVASYNVNTMYHGCADLVATSLSKIFSGTSNVMAGSVVLNPASPIATELGALFDPEADSFIVEDDVKSLLETSEDLAARLSKTNATTAEIVERLQKHPLIKDIYYPTLSGAESLYDPFLVPSESEGKPRYGPLFSILLSGGLEPAEAFYNTLTIAKGPSLGTNFSLCCPYSVLAHYNELDFVESCGVDRHLIRISIGQEDIEVIWNDFEKALAAANAIITSGATTK
ncbi:hypothetical protein BBO99_00003654 [Phytophthora kernoviae]|uniref:Cystathionine gamma-synthase n=2 Tax=Phytophthora kernoviae TaxID=325452 RepID=A0A3R7KL18_9STRA|nr:hypothetical protein G195_004151 [Phytophthora kernoviae 00238/432]KAG2522097.1 hypothetical protein JM18_006283 [Phytophthora kernoviae]KAG2527182.1 hypothetical protein JM16_003534 [Phytophthora kernoviae]RLN81524.1 hypothetical protein BBO99_00003654 [Phytophthora kernoviae]